MPELPEVETIANGLNKRVAGDRIDSVWVGSKPEPLKSSAAEISGALEGAHVERVRRVGKHIVFDLGSGKSSGARQWIVHLGMTGRMLVSTAETEIPKHTHLVARLASGRELRFVDPRRFGRLEVRADFSGPGAEPLSIGAVEFARLFHSSKAPVKAALLNQKLLHGVGNIYADEALFRAHIRPRRRANTLTKVELRKLHAALQKVLHAAIAAGGSSISDYVDADGEAGFFQIQHRAYGRQGKPCMTCKTPIKKIVVGGRGTHYCPNCQK
jgi:formamidopyrimidine-DNA glycosylase